MFNFKKFTLYLFSTICFTSNVNGTLLKIVLTGGPYAGKTTFANLLAGKSTDHPNLAQLASKTFPYVKFFTVPEAATQLHNQRIWPKYCKDHLPSGVSAEDVDFRDNDEFDELVFKTQFETEFNKLLDILKEVHTDSLAAILNSHNLTENTAKMCSIDLKKEILKEVKDKLNQRSEIIVIIYDRGLTNTAAYNPKVFTDMIEKYKLSYSDVSRWYDYVIHLETLAKNGTYLCDNKSRTESSKEASDIDQKLLTAWNSYYNVKVLDQPKIEDRFGVLLDFISSFIQIHSLSPLLDY